MSDTADALIAAAARAFRRTRFYGELYATEPSNTSEIPYIAVSDYHRAAGVLDCVVDREAMIGILPPYYRDASRFPFVVPEDEAELISRQQRIVRAFKDLGVDVGTSPRFLIVADARRGPFACELAKGIYWEGFQTSMTYFHGSSHALRSEIAAHDPDYVVLASGRHLRHALERPRRAVIVVERCGDHAIDDLEYPSLLYADEVDLVGSRPAGRQDYDYESEQLRIEVDPVSRLAHVSKLQFTCFPLIRYSLGRHVPTGSGPQTEPS